MLCTRLRNSSNFGFVVILCLTVLPFAVYAVSRGVSLPDLAEQANSRFFVPGAVLSNLFIYGHMVSGGLVTLLAPLQLLGMVRRRWPRAHYLLGYSVAALAVFTAISGGSYIIVRGTIGGPVMSLGFGFYGILLMLSAIRSVGLARRRDPLHIVWAERLIILSLASWLYRVHYGLWEIATGGAGSSPDFSGPFDFVQVFAFYVPYLVLHAWFRSKYPPRLL